MKRVLPVVTVAALFLGGLALMGCESSNQSNLPAGEQGNTAGGNGVFGENPDRPGDYSHSTNTTGSNYMRTPGSVDPAPR